MEFPGGLPLQQRQLLSGASYLAHMPQDPNMASFSEAMMKSAAVASNNASLLNSELVKKEMARAKLRAKNRIHAKTSRERKKEWLDGLKKTVAKLNTDVGAKREEIKALEKALDVHRSKYYLLESDMHAVQALFKECASASGDKGKEADDNLLLQQHEAVLGKSDFEYMKNHISTTRTFLNEMLTSTKIEEIMGLCCHGATFHWPSVSTFSSGTIQSYLQFPRYFKAAYLPDLAFTQPSVTFSEDNVSVVLIFSGTHTENNGNAAMAPATPPRRFETTVVYVFSFNSRGKISHLSKTFDIADMYHQLGWSRKMSNEISNNDPFLVEPLSCNKTLDVCSDEKDEPKPKKVKREDKK